MTDPLICFLEVATLFRVIESIDRDEPARQFAELVARRGEPRVAELFEHQAGLAEAVRFKLACDRKSELSQLRRLTRFESKPRVSIIVTARNYGRFLAECLASCLDQTEESVEVVYSDDASTDDSLAIARRFDDVRVVACNNHTGVCASRNRGVRASRGDILIHVDGDDVLPPDFVAKHLSALTPASPFAYGPAQAFGLVNNYWGVKSWGELPIWEMNFVNTSAAIWRWAFEAAGGWRENPSGTMWDWHLFLRASRFGRPAASEATLSYRQHSSSWSHTHEVESDFGRRLGLLELVRRDVVRVSIGCIYSGRLIGLLPSWLDAIAAAVRRTPLAERPELLIVDNSSDGRDSLYRETSRFADVFSSVRILPQRWLWNWRTETERQEQVAEFMADSSNLILEETTGEIVWLVEDDVLPPEHACETLFKRLTEGYPLTAAVAGSYQNRHTRAGFVSGYWRDGQPQHLRELPSEPAVVDLTGTGCLMFWRSLAPTRFTPKIGAAAAHDWAFSKAIRDRGRDVLLLPSVRCRHYVTEREWI